MCFLVNLFFRTLHQRRAKLSVSETQVYRYLLNDPERFYRQNSREIALKSYVSVATVTRMCQKLGFDSFTSFKYALKAGLKTDDNFMAASYLDTSVASCSIALSEQDQETIDWIVDRIASTAHIEVVGLGPSYAVAVHLARRLIFARKNVSCRSEWDEILQMLNIAKDNSLIILISASGNTRNILEYAEILRKKGVPTISFVGAAENPLSKIVTKSINLSIEPAYYLDIDLTSRVQLFQLVELIVNKYIVEQI